MTKFNTIIIGLENELNLCYFNSILQILFNISPLNKFIIKKNEENVTNNKENFVQVYKSTLNILHSDNIIDDENVLNLAGLKDILGEIIPEYKEDKQQDAQETLLYILDIIHLGLTNKEKIEIPLYRCEIIDIPMEKLRYYALNCWNENIKIENYSIVSNLFKGQLRTKITCQECYTEVNKFETFNMITLSLPEGIDNISIEDCISSYCKPEFLNKDELYECETCHHKVEAFKDISFWRLPKYLLIHFNRFIQKYENNKIKLIKNNTKVSYPFSNLKLLNEYLKDGHTSSYKINSVIKHHGNDINNGHYTSYILKDNICFHIDDENIEIVEDLTDEPYILVYENTFD